MASSYTASGIKSNIKIEGLEELRRALRDLPEALLQTQALSAGVSAGAKVMRDEARSRVLILKKPDKRRTPGLVRRMLRATRGIRRSSEVSAFVSVRRLTAKAIGKFKRKTGKDAADNPLDPFYWSILEFGKSTRTAHPFLRPAFDTKKEAAAHAIKDGLRKGIEKAAAKVKGRKLW